MIRVKNIKKLNKYFAYNLGAPIDGVIMSDGKINREVTIEQDINNNYNNDIKTAMSEGRFYIYSIYKIDKRKIKEENMKKIDILITHKNCADGTGVAMAVKEYCRVTGQKEPEIIFLDYSDEFNIERLKNKHVIIADFSFDKITCETIDLIASSILILDHHKTAKEALDGLDYVIFDMNKSGAVLTWEYLFPNEEIPMILRYIQDRDLWLWKINESRAFSAGFILYNQQKIVEDIDSSEFFDNTFVESIVREGKAIVKYQDSIIRKNENNIDKVKTINIDGYIASCTNNTHLISELGNMYAKSFDFSLQYFFTEKDVVFSLRSVGDFDVSKIAKSYGGGGHKNAAGFSIPLSEFDATAFFTKQVIKKLES